ncbi:MULTISPECIES: hypothetical protein [Rhizobium]|uniref:Membrane-anchored protein n=1 Tax=Rhizobium rhododendri TaxID=2506430 RepID=A0ABY8IRI4_9HYPH|nr:MULTISPECIES: hypothetical protein [Rhizobium]TQX84253.1 hypothetical protein EQW76_25945 [Rhizobium sp. rho-13.1]TQY07812.1 hypothetical protein EQW74_25075 [Rhizobium sp. rho-1.1]WFS26324.1 hypothetical protein PR018_25200 [Rhizobium rhododendri]
MVDLCRKPDLNIVYLETGASKVPEVTALFWIIKILLTGMGETTSDYLVNTIDPMVAVGIGGVAFVASLALQLRAKRYIAWIYWLAVVMVSVFGTMAADVVHVALGISYAISTPFFAVALAVIFAIWQRTEGTLSIHSVYTTRRELFYWATVSTTFALGTAAGDLTATNMGLGYLQSGILFAVVFALPAIAYWKLGFSEIATFWFAYVVTRPLGASFADWMGVNAARGGLNWGTGPVSLVLAILICALVVYSSLTRKRSKTELSAGGY